MRVIGRETGETNDVGDLLLVTGNFMNLVEQVHLKQHRRMEKSWMAVSHCAVILRLYNFGELSMSEIATKINRTAPTATVLVKKLKEEGLVVSRKSRSDERKTVLSLTEAGKNYGLQTEEYISKIRHELGRGVTAEEVETVIRVLKKMKTNIRNL